MDAEETTLLLPKYQPSTLESIPIYNIVLDTYDVISARVDTSLKYDQLKSPQVHSFLIKPLVNDLREDLSPGTLYALMANIIQFNKEKASYAAMAGVLSTRAMICEIVAIKLLKDFDDDDLMNALTYDFYPLSRGEGVNREASKSSSQLIPRWQRLSTLELAIKGEAKKFLANPVVVQILEEIWNGSIMFQTSMHKLHKVKFANEEEVVTSQFGRRGAGIRYNYEEASILKLSRLRVPRYRHLLNLGSFCVLLTLYLIVLSSHKMEISTQEIIFTFWSLGFILDEIVGFTDVGFTLYILSLWNLFDFMILFQLLAYGVFRIIALRLNQINHEDAKKYLTISYDILATVAIFLFPRLFSIFDNYQSFSRMIIAVRKMSIDLAISWLVIIMLSSGFWVAFTMAFAREVFTSNQVAFDLMRILFGFTPVVWENWKYYSPIGRIILLFYLFITHFVIMTLLFAVLSNSFSEIVANSHEEHQYLFAVNTISMIKSESSTLFSYSPPLNLLEWLIRPLFYILPLRKFLVLNRTLVKITHFPVLYTIFIYERLYLRFVQVKERMTKDNQKEYRKKQEERLKSMVNQLLDETLLNPKSRKRTNQGTTSATPRTGTSTPLTPSDVRKRHQLMSKKVSKYDLLDEVFKRPYKGTIKVKPNKPTNNNDNLDHLRRPSLNKSTLSKYRRGSSWTSSRPDNEIYSDPEDNLSRPYYDSDVLEDDEWNDSYINDANTFQRHPSTSSRRGQNRLPTILPTVPSSTILDKFYIEHDPDNDTTNSKRQAALSRSFIRKRLFSSTSSLFRQDNSILGISPTRSTSSFLGKRRLPILRGIPNKKSSPKRQTYHTEEGYNHISDVVDAYASDDDNDYDEIDDEQTDIQSPIVDNDSDIRQMQQTILTRMDNLEVVFKNIESHLSRLNPQS